MKKLALVFAIGVVTLTAPASAEKKSPQACLSNCQQRLKQAGTWNQYPRGYCKKQCGIPTQS
jgi:hypothetical protein